MAVKLCLQPYKRLPEKGTPGWLYYCTDTPHGIELFIAARDGKLCPISEFFTVQVVGVGPTGETGPAGKDSTVPGPRGEKGDKGERGESGPRGEKGDVLVLGESELADAVRQLRNELLQRRARGLAVIADGLAHLGNTGAERLVRQHLEAVQREIQ